jgi:hypothetical protein
MANLRGHKRWKKIISEFEEHLFGLGKAQNSISTYGTTIRAFRPVLPRRTQRTRTILYPSKLQETDLQAFVWIIWLHPVSRGRFHQRENRRPERFFLKTQFRILGYKIYYGPNFMANFFQVELKLAKCGF